VPSAADRYDYILTKHYHVQCTRCKKFINVEGLEYDQHLDDKIAQLPASAWKITISSFPVYVLNARLKWQQGRLRKMPVLKAIRKAKPRKLQHKIL
jgi:Fur family peroxide stress response transcriptional regulator